MSFGETNLLTFRVAGYRSLLKSRGHALGPAIILADLIAMGLPNFQAARRVDQ
jgi:hypothetical protein